MKNALLFQRAVFKENQRFFSPRSLQLDFLKNWPRAIPTIAHWIYEEWRSFDPTLTKEKLIAAFETRLNDDRIPLTLLILKKGEPIGVISLKKESSFEFSDFPEDAVWIGSFQIVPEERRRGLGQELLKFAAQVAMQLGHKELYFYTSKKTNVEWYLKRGAQVLEERPFHNHTVTLMQLPLKRA